MIRRQEDMFKDVFDYGKTRNFKESVGFYIVHTAIALIATSVISLF
tara:strand:+ start:1291 stop:1428 length:138 start_codon:yes stop_codon:yes gene_type:complete